MDCIDNLTFCDHLTSADNITVCRFLFDQCHSFFFTQSVWIQDSFSCCNEIFFFFQMKLFFQNPCNHLTDCRTTGKSRRFNSCTVNKSFRIFYFFYDKFMSFFMCTKSCKRSNYLTHRNVFYILSCFCKYLIQSFSCRIRSFFFFYIDRCRSKKEIAVCSRCNQNSFSEFIWQSKYCLAHMCACCFIQQTIITSSWCDVYLLFTDHIVEFVCINAGRIHHIFCLEHTLICVNFPDTILFFQFLYFCIKFEFHTIFTGIFCHRNIQPKWTYDSG